MNATVTVDVTDRDVAIAEIRAALRRRSGKAWSVTGGRGTAWGWITITVPPAQRERCGVMPVAAQAELAALMGVDHVHCQGLQVAASSAHRREFVARARGEEPPAIAQPYWD